MTGERAMGGSMRAYWVLATIIFLGFAAFTATALTMAIDLAPPEARGRASGLFTSAQGLAQISGKWVGGPLAAALGFRALFGLAAATVLGGAVYSYVVLGRPQAGTMECPQRVCTDEMPKQQCQRPRTS